MYRTMYAIVEIGGHQYKVSKNDMLFVDKQNIDGNKLSDMLNQITDPTEYINAVSKLLPYILSKIKAKEEKEHFDPVNVIINFEEDKIKINTEKQKKLLNQVLNKKRKPS